MEFLLRIGSGKAVVRYKAPVETNVAVFVTRAQVTQWDGGDTRQKRYEPASETERQNNPFLPTIDSEGQRKDKVHGQERRPEERSDGKIRRKKGLRFTENVELGFSVLTNRIVLEEIEVRQRSHQVGGRSEPIGDRQKRDDLTNGGSSELTYSQKRENSHAAAYDGEQAGSNRQGNNAAHTAVCDVVFDARSVVSRICFHSLSAQVLARRDSSPAYRLPQTLTLDRSLLFVAQQVRGI